MTDAPLTIREARPGDGMALVAAMAAIDAETVYLAAPDERPGWSDDPDGFLARLAEADGGVYLVAERAGVILGYAGALTGPFRSTRGTLSVPHIGVRTAARRSGAGRGLLAGVEAWGRARGVHRIELTVEDGNEAARAFYARCGFEPEGLVREAAWDRGGWRSYLALARLLDPDGSVPLPEPPAGPARRADSIEIGFRTLEPADAAALHRWELQLLSEPPDLLKQPDEVSPPALFAAELAGALASPLQLLVAALHETEAEATIVGLLSVSGKPQARLRHDWSIVVNVLQAYRGLGIGRRLLAIGEGWAREQGAHRLSSAAHSANAPGLRFALAAGYQAEAVMRQYARRDGGHVDLVTLGKLLPS